MFSVPETEDLDIKKCYSTENSWMNKYLKKWNVAYSFEHL